MITIRLDYPYRDDLRGYGIPLPETFEVKDICVLLFDGTGDYYDYLGSICDVVDDLEFNWLMGYTRQKADKLKFCKRYLALLAGATLVQTK
jgi:hypothetical protein